MKNNKTIEKQLSKYLTMEDLDKIIPNPDIRNKWNWINVGVKPRIKVNGKCKNEWGKPIKLPTLNPKSKVLINPKDLVKFLKDIGREDLITEIPKYLRD